MPRRTSRLKPRLALPQGNARRLLIVALAGVVIGYAAVARNNRKG